MYMEQEMAIELNRQVLRKEEVHEIKSQIYDG